MAGQPGYRLIHQLHLDQVAVALILFDARSDTEPLAGVKYWVNALRQAQSSRGDATVRKFLVAARVDRGGAGISRARVEQVLRDLDIEDYIETSAKEGLGIAELAQKLRAAIDWDTLPKISSSSSFQQLKAFLVEEKQSGIQLIEQDALYRTFLKAENTPEDTGELRAEFENGIDQMQCTGFLRGFSFGNLLLLQPELIDAYASAMVNAAKEEPDGLGYILEEDALMGRFRMSQDERIRDPAQERLLLIATVEELLCREIALREQTDDGAVLIFPSQFIHEASPAERFPAEDIIFCFDGALSSIYASLAIRLSRSGIFQRESMWSNAALFRTIAGGTCGIRMREISDGSGELTLFFGDGVSKETRLLFEHYVQAHLRTRTVAESLSSYRIFVCL